MNKEELKKEALQLRASGLTYSEISSALNGAFSVDQCKKLLKGIKATPMQNDIRELFADEWYGRIDSDIWPLWVDDIVSGVARLDWYGNKDGQIPLATGKIIQCYLWLDEFSEPAVMELLETSKKMAQYYIKACKACYPFFRRSLESKEVLSIRYPRRSIVCYQQGVTKGYHRQNRALI